MSWVALIVHLEESCQNGRLSNSNYNCVEEISLDKGFAYWKKTLLLAITSFNSICGKVV
jgi:hypothetical protein